MKLYIFIKNGSIAVPCVDRSEKNLQEKRLRARQDARQAVNREFANRNRTFLMESKFNLILGRMIL